METFCIDKVIKRLSQHKQIFHSEDDMRNSICEEIKKIHPNSLIQKEVPFKVIEGYTEDNSEKEFYAKNSKFIDILVSDVNNDNAILIECKYKTKPLSITVKNQEYCLSDHKGENDNRYLYLHDVSRLENYIVNNYNNHKIKEAYAVFITNNKKYQDEKKGSVIDDFDISPGSIKTGALHHKNFKQNILLIGQYPIVWREYSRVDGEENNIFWICITKVTDPRTALLVQT